MSQEIAPHSRVQSASERLLGTIVGDRYVLRREAGRGGVAAVYIADHLFTGRTVAVKMILPDIPNKQEARTRLLREARNLGRVEHPNVVALLDAGVSASGPYLVMERLRGRSLEGLVASRGKLFIYDVLRIARLAGKALDAIHSAGLIHCDVKPGNMFVTRAYDGAKSMKMIDFGVSRTETDAPEETVSGTPVYMAPEQLHASEILPASDIYGLGASLYECLTGHVPFTGSIENIIARAMTQPPDPILELRPDTPKSLAQLVEVCLSRDPLSRFANGGAFLKALDWAEAYVGQGRSTDTLPPSVPEGDDDSRRGFARAVYGAPVELWVGEQVIQGRSEDISEGGLLIIADGVVDEGTQLTLRLPLPATGSIVACPARIQWVRERETGKSAMGIELVDLESSVRQAIADYVGTASVPIDTP
jgi:serine/threonine-protein kinase